MATRKKQEEKRIYVIVPETVQVVQKRGERPVTRRMEAGRLMAQCAHVVTQLRVTVENLHEFRRKPVTTIVLSVRNSRELDKVYGELSQVATTWRFEDDNEPFYGTKKRVLTALAIGPLVKTTQIDDAIGHLDLYK